MNDMSAIEIKERQIIGEYSDHEHLHSKKHNGSKEK